MSHVSLPMFDAPALRPQWQEFWALIRAHLPKEIDAPDQLIWPGDTEYLRAGDVLLSQTCSFPYRAGLHHHLQVIGAFDFGLPGCVPGYYNSVLITRPGVAAECLENLTPTINSYDSQSGHAALVAAVGSLKTPPVVTGSHAASIKAVLGGQADLAAIDAQSFAFACDLEPALSESLQVVQRTPPTPGLPLVTSHAQMVPVLRQALDAAISDMPAPLRKSLHVQGLVRFKPLDFLS